MYQRRFLDRLDRRRHRHRLAGAGGPQQRRVALAGADPFSERRDRRRLIGGRMVGGVDISNCGIRRSSSVAIGSDGTAPAIRVASSQAAIRVASS